ncbi:reverse transcriptase domain-containing protein [Tanacetum coccineum]
MRCTSLFVGIRTGIYGRRAGNDTLGKQRDIARRRHGKRATLQVDFILKAKSDSASDTLSYPLIHTPEFGPGVRHGTRLTRVVSLCVGDPEEKNDEELEDLQKPYKEVLKSPFSRRIIEFSAPNHQTLTNLKIYDGSTDADDHITRFVGAANQGEWEMLVWCRMFQQTLDGLARGWFNRMPNGCIDNWTDLREAFVERFALRRKCCKDPTEVSRIVRKANETLHDFKERWTEERSYIPDFPTVMQISSFMSNSTCPELARRFSDQVPKTVTEMMKRVDDFVKSE